MNQITDPQGLKEALKTSGIGWWHQADYHEVYVRAGFRCEYCGFDLNSSLSAYIRFCEYDHILPKDKYIQLISPPKSLYTQCCTDFRNLALACCACNSLKSNFDPGAGIVEHTTTDFSLELREQLLAIARDHVMRLRASKEQDYRAVLNLVERFSTPE